MEYYLAVDIGASSGRHILGWVDNGRIGTEEIYRFENGMRMGAEGLEWDIEALFGNVLAGIRRCAEIGKIPASIAIDTWGVDYVLLDENKKELLPAVAYRNDRTADLPESKDFPVDIPSLYSRTGIQRQTFNTVYQLWCDKQSGKLAKAKYFLLMPEYLSYRLTGAVKNEYTNASTTGLLNAAQKTWDKELLETLGYPPDLFGDLSVPGDVIGPLSDEIAADVGFTATVRFAPSHDTASAVAACPIDDRSVYISSGTWSLFGTENSVPVLSEEARIAGFTNEGGVEYRFRFLKNIMGMWLLQGVRRSVNKQYTYDEMMTMAEESAFDRLIDPNATAFVAPDDMLAAIRQYLGDPALELADALKSVYLSLAGSYNETVRQIETITGKHIENILILGGGSKDVYLNRLTAAITGKRVFTGLTEATALGNLMSQYAAAAGLSLDDTRKLIKKSFDIKETTV